MTLGTVIVVGVGPGLGLSVGRAFAAAGHPVALLSRNQGTVDAFAAELTSDATPVRGYAADASSAASLRAAITAAVADLGPIDALVYNAAVLRPDTPTDGDDEGWANAIAVDLLGAKASVEAALPALRDGKGSVLLTGGGFALYPNADFASVSIGKAALRTYGQVLQSQLGTNVHVATVTIVGSIGGGEERFAPDTLAAHYTTLHAQPQDQWQSEIIAD